MKEHEAIKQMLKIMEGICDKLESGDSVDRSHLEQVVDFIKNFADKCHHGKEEDILFETMGEVGFAKEAGPISVMLSEHDMGRNLVKRLAEAVEQYNTGKENAVSSIVDYARRYSSLLDQHIGKENNILYPMANGHFTQEHQDKMSEEFEEFEKQKMGPGKHEQYHTILNDLSVIYLK
jgi:hemerythrin-like domain-containing protein